MARHKQVVDRESVLLVGNFRPTLPVARSLSKAGYRVILAADGFPAAERSRFVDEVWQSKAEPFTSDDFVGELRKFAASRDDLVGVYPISQRMILELMPQSQRLSVPLITVAPDLFKTSVDKVRTSRLASDVGIPVARFAEGSSVQDLIEIADDLGYPCVFKRNDGLERGVKAIVFRDRSQAQFAAERRPDLFDNFMVQQFASGGRLNRYFIAHQGRILRSLDIKTFRTDRIDDTGLGVSGMSVAPFTKLDRPSHRLVEALNYTGVGCLQYLVNDGRSSISFLEINARIGGNYAFTHDCGLDQASAFLDVLQGRRLEHWAAPFAYPTGKRYAWLLGDLDGLLQSLEARAISGSEAASWLVKAVWSGLRAHNHLQWRWDDPGPALYLGRKSIAPLSRRAFRQTARLLLHRSKALGGRLALRAR